MTPPEGVEVDDNWIDVMVDWANIVYRQVGIEFYLVSVETNVADSTLWDLTYNKWSVENGERKKVLSSEAESLVNTYTGGDCIEVYLVGQTHDMDAASSGAKTLGFWTDKGIVVGYDRPTALAHELGHALGLEDCYTVSNGIELPGLRDTVSGSLFSDQDRDFYGDVSGRGFYPKDVTVATILSRLLMNGNALGGMDIPAGAVKAFPEEDVDSPQAMDIPVGYLYFHQSDQEVFSK